MSYQRRLHQKVCLWCGHEWETVSIKSRTCSPQCRGKLRVQEGTSRRDYPAEIVERVRELYNSPMGQDGVQRIIPAPLAFLRFASCSFNTHYAAVDDYARMCLSCHRQYDGARRKQTGEPTMPRQEAS